MSQFEGSECIEALIPYVKAFSYTWFNLQSSKRRYLKQHETPLPYELEKGLKEEYMHESYENKIKWAVRILAKLRKDIYRDCRQELVKTISNQSVNGPCIISNPDTKNKMRRIDCLRQADKVWRLDVVMVVLFRGIPLESTDGERLTKCKECKNPALCINPYHVVLHVKELEVYLVNYINAKEQSMVTNKNIIPSVFSTNDLQLLSSTSIDEGGSMKDVIGSDYLGSMLKMETDEYTEQNIPSQPDLLKMCRSRKPSLSGSPRTAKRRRTIANPSSHDETDGREVPDASASNVHSYDMLDSTTPFQQRNEQPALKNEQNITQLSSSSITISSNIKQSSSSSLTTAMGDKQYNEKYNQVVCSCSSASTNYTTLTTPSSFQKQNNDSSRQQPVMYGSLRSISPKSGVSLHIKASTSNQDSPSNDMSPYQQQAQMQPPSSGSEIVDKGTDSSRPFSQIGIHNHVSLKLHFNNQTPQQPSAIPPPVQVPIQPQTPAPVPYTTNISDSKDVSDRLIQTLVQRFQNNQQKSTSTHPHTIEYFRQDSTKSGSMNNQSVLDQQRPSSLNIIFSSHNNNSTTPVPSTSSTLSNGPTIPQHQKSSFIQSTNILTAKQQEMIHQMPQQHRSTQQQSFDQSNLLEPLHNTYSSNKNTNYTARFSDFKSSPNMMNEGKQQDSQPSLPKEPVNNDMSSNNLLRLTSTHQHQSLPQFTTLADLKEYLQKMGLVIELVPTDQPSPTQLKNVPTSTLPPPPPPSTAKSVIQLERDQAVRSGAISGMSDHGQIVLKTQPQVVMVMNNNSQRLMSNIREENGGRVQEQQQQQSSRSSSIEKSLSVPPSVLTEKLLEYAATTSNNQQYQQNSSKQIVSNIANLLVKTTDKEQSVLSPTQSVIQITQNNHVQQITRSTVPSETYRSSTIQQPQHQQMSSVDHTPIIIPTRTQIVNNPMDSYNNNSNNNNNMKSYNNMDLIRFQQAPQSHSSDNRHLRMNLDDKTQKITPEKVRRELTSTLFNLHHHSHQHHDIPLLQDHDGHLHDREVEEFMIGKESITKDATKLKLFHNKSDDDKMSTTQTMITTGSNDSNSCTPSTITINNNSNDNNNSNNPNGNHNNNSNKLNAQGHASKSSGQSICELLMLLYEQERTRSTQLQKQIDQVSRQRSRNSSGQSSESQTGLETPHGLDNRHGAPLSPAAWGLSGSASNSNSNSNSASTSRGANGKEKSMNILNGLSQMPSHALNRPLKFDPSYNGDSESQDRDLNECSPPDSNKNAISPTKVTQFSAVIPSQSIPRPVPLIQTQDGLVRHTTTTATTNSSVNTGMTTNSTANGQFFSPSNRVFQSPLSQLFQNALSPAACGVLSPFLSPSTSRSDTPSELILPHDLISVLNSRVWSEEDLLNAFIKNFDPSGLQQTSSSLTRKTQHDTY